MRNEVLEKMVALQRSNIPFAHASIARRTAPSSGKPGDHALITSDGKIHGWIGGGCTRGIVLKEALLSLQDHKSRYVSINNNPQPTTFSNTKVYSMTCQSGGEVEVYIEPVLPKPQLVIFGSSHIGMAICKVAKSMDYRVTAVMSSADQTVYPSADDVISTSEYEASESTKGSYAIVCTQGEGDVPALLKALEMDTEYIAFVASRMKAQSIFTDLRKHSITFDQLKKIKTPAGIDIGGKLAEEVAISILAEIIQHFRSDDASGQDKSEVLSAMPNDDFYINPVCKIPIQKSTAKYVLQHNGESVYFCCDGCKVSFEKEPEKYIQ